MAVTVSVFAGLALAAGAPAAAVALGVAVAWHPVPTVLGVVAWSLRGRLVRRRRRPDAGDEAAFLRGLAAELAAGAAPRAALVEAVSRTPDLPLREVSRLAAAGSGADRVARALAGALPVNGELAGAAWSLSTTTGGAASAIFATLAERASDEGALRREARAMTAQARASAWVVAGLPAALVAAMAATGRLRPGAEPVLDAVLAVGLSLQALGIWVVVLMLRRAT